MRRSQKKEFQASSLSTAAAAPSRVRAPNMIVTMPAGTTLSLDVPWRPTSDSEQVACCATQLIIKVREIQVRDPTAGLIRLSS